MRRLFGLMLFAGCGFSLFGQNLLNNPGFENSSAWLAPKYWAGELNIISPGLKGKSCGELKAGQQGKNFYGRCYQLARVEPAWGRRFAYSMQARGAGDLYLGYLLYTKNEQEKIVSEIVYSAPLSLKKDEWQEIRMDILAVSPRLVRIAPLIEIRGENSVAFLDEGRLAFSPVPGAVLSAFPAHPVIEEGKPAPDITFRLTLDGKPAADAALKILDGDKLQDGISDKDGLFVGRPGADSGGVAVSAVQYGIAADVFIDRLGREAWNNNDRLARKIKLNKPLFILYLGDSLSDFERGHNYADKVDFWLNLHNPGLATFRNAGVRGDYITRTRDRLIRGGAFQQEKYDGLFDVPYDYIFIFLGHNDTRSRSNENYAVALVPPETQKTAYREVINHIRKHSKAKIVLVSPASSNFDKCRESAEKLAAQQKPHSLFGDPGKLEAFDAVLRELAKEENLGYLDVYTPTRNAPDKAALFSPTDGVHLTEAGNRFLSGLFLEFLSK